VTSAPFRLGQLVDGKEQRYSQPAAFRVDYKRATKPRLLAGVPGSDPAVFAALVAELPEPLVLLLVLHTPRGVAEPGRYQSPDLSHADVAEFLARFGAYVSGDGRHDLWAYSPDAGATVVWDRHDQLFGYGPVDAFAATLRRLGFDDGLPVIPAPHAHHYHAGFDADLAALLAWRNWLHSPLQPQDEQ
jgi:hypothetical protein